MAASIGAGILAAHMLTPQVAMAGPVTNHLVEAEELVDELNAIGWPLESSYNKYCSSGCTGSVVTWGTPGTPTSYYNESQCAPFVTQLLTHTYSWATRSYFSSEFSSISPNSARYYDRIDADTVDHMDKITKVASLAPGDIIAIKYEAGASGGSGHTPVVRSVAGTVVTDSDPNTTEYVVEVVDSTNTPHGTAPVADGHVDSRSSGSTEYSGVGYGFMVLYADANGDFYGYRWGTNESTFHPVTIRPIVAARVTSEA
ncbi:hypothetical protein AB0O28_38765 [Microbispora sp. NPDC088329]|uniref:hypothetical protein n=1 Tax=Microbispora sp. NPDC088329 TaxID=3154869 RepID=UPI00342D1788